MRVALIVLLSFCFFVLGVFSLSIWKALNPDHIVVRVIDDNKCLSPEYSVEMESHTVSVKGAQIDSPSTRMGEDEDIFLYAGPPHKAEDEMRYRLRARYSDCAEVLSEERVVEAGWILYERIENGRIHHMVRAR